MPRRRYVAAVAVFLAAAPVGCSNRDSAAARAPRETGTVSARPGSDGTQQVVIAGNEQFRFVPSTIRAKAGRLRIVLTNSGTTPHNLQVDGAGQAGFTGLVGAGERAQVTVSLTPGRHRFVCTLHTRLHMVGTIVVS